jgi:hypothetical protein
LHRPLGSDEARIGHVENGQASALILFDIQKGSAIKSLAKQHSFTGMPSHFGKIRWWYDNSAVDGFGMRGRCRNDSTGDDRNDRSA